MIENEALKKEDGRYFAIDNFNAGTSSIATTETFPDFTGSFGLPSSPGLFLSLAHKFRQDLKNLTIKELFDDHSQGIWPDSQKSLFDTIEKISAHIIFSYSAIEAFLNEAIPDDFTYNTTDKEGNNISLDKANIERWTPTKEKLDQILPQALGVPSPKGTKPWQNYVELERLRNRLIHLKSEDRKANGPEVPTIWGDLLRNIHTPFCDNAHDLMGRYGDKVKRRWFQKYPYVNLP